MGSKRQLGKKIAALLLFVALMLPSAIQFIHMSDGHEHVACKEKTTHIHKSVVKLSLIHI